MPRIVHCFVFDSLSDWEPGHAIAGLNTPQFQREPGRYLVRSFSLDGRPVTTAGGLRVTPDLALDAVQPQGSAMLILPGGSAWDEGHNREAAELAGRFLRAGVPVAAICGATAGLARQGLLDARPHTSNAREYLNATKYGGSAHYREEPVVVDGDLITAAAMAPLEFARAIFERLEVYAPRALDAWFNLFSTRRPEYFGELMAALAPAGAEASA
jgi:putative intracellular protease/amidase